MRISDWSSDVCSSDLRADRFAGGYDHDRQYQHGQGQASGEDAFAKTDLIHQQTQCQQAVDDRRHTSKIGDIDLDDFGQQSLARIFLEVDAGAYADRPRSEGRREGTEWVSKCQARWSP